MHFMSMHLAEHGLLPSYAPLQYYAMSNQIFPENLSLVCKITGNFSDCTFQGSIRESETFIKIKVLRYLNNTHCIIDIVMCWSININYCYCLFYIYFECPFSVTVFL